MNRNDISSIKNIMSQPSNASALGFEPRHGHWENLIDYHVKHEDDMYRAITYDGNMVGFIGLQFVGEREEIGTLFEIEEGDAMLTIYLDANHRGLGLGTFAFSQMRDMVSGSVFASTFDDNKVMEKFLRKNGFVFLSSSYKSGRPLSFWIN